MRGGRGGSEGGGLNRARALARLFRMNNGRSTHGWTALRLAGVSVVGVVMLAFAFGFTPGPGYRELYRGTLEHLATQQSRLASEIVRVDLRTGAGRDSLRGEIAATRLKLKAADFWLRYLEPNTYRRMNGPLPVEWETEVFEKFEKPYRRVGAGLTLAELALDDSTVTRDSLLALVRASMAAAQVFEADSITRQLVKPDHFFLANRLFLLNLGAIYTTGFECPAPPRVVPELRAMLTSTRGIYAAFARDFPATPLSPAYLQRYDAAIAFAGAQPDDYAAFDHFAFIRDHVNPLFAMNQTMILGYNVASHSVNDFTLNDSCVSMFDKGLYNAQNTKGVYSLIEDPRTLARIRETGRLLFYDPLMSGNNQRACVSCHKPSQYFSDNSVATPESFEHAGRLKRNAPSLVDAPFNHLLMLDGRHLTLQAQAHDVMTNPTELGSNERSLVDKVMSCKDYRSAFRSFLKWIPEEPKVTLDHLISAITSYYGGFSYYPAAFDDAINGKATLAPDAHRGFNLFMSKAQCATCHFVPQFNGVKPPYVGSEFEVLGVPADTLYARLDADSGRAIVNPALETVHAFRTGSLRNIAHTGPYMHNGVFRTLEQVVEFYDAGGGAGHRLNVPNQTLAADSLHLSAAEKSDLIAFMRSLDERVPVEAPPAKLPRSSRAELNRRRIGGEY